MNGVKGVIQKGNSEGESRRYSRGKISGRRNSLLIVTATIRTLTTSNSNRFQVLDQQDTLDGPTSTPHSSLPFKLPKATTLGSGLDQVSPHSCPSGLLDACCIKELIEENAKNFFCKERL